MSVSEEHMWMVGNNYSQIVYWDSEKIIDIEKKGQT